MTKMARVTPRRWRISRCSTVCGITPVVGGNREQHEVDGMSSGEHVADESLVSRYVDDPRARAIPEIQPGKAEIDRNAALFFFLEPVGVLTGQRFDQSRLAVIDVSGGADDPVHGSLSAVDI